MLIRERTPSVAYQPADDLRSSFANNVNDNVNDKDNVNVNDNGNLIDNDNANDSDNDIDIDNDLRSSFPNNDNDNDNDNFIYLFGEKHQKVKPNNNSSTNSISIREPALQINTNDDLQSWLNDDIITEVTFPNSFRCISGPSECGKTISLKKTNSS